MIITLQSAYLYIHMLNHMRDAIRAQSTCVIHITVYRLNIVCLLEKYDKTHNDTY